MGDRKGVGMDGKGDREELVGVEGGEAMIEIYYVNKESIFNKRKKSIPHN